MIKKRKIIKKIDGTKIQFITKIIPNSLNSNIHLPAHFQAPAPLPLFPFSFQGKHTQFPRICPPFSHSPTFGHKMCQCQTTSFPSPIILIQSTSPAGSVSQALQFCLEAASFKVKDSSRQGAHLPLGLPWAQKYILHSMVSFMGFYSGRQSICCCLEGGKLAIWLKYSHFHKILFI